VARPADRRQHPRKKVSLRVTMMMVEPVQGYVRDMSLSGLFVNTALKLRVGEEIDLEIAVRGGVLAIRSEVVRVVQPIGVALKFVDPPPETIERLDRLLEAEGKAPTGDI
jgi:hypothetical protein